jgi:transposase
MEIAVTDEQWKRVADKMSRQGVMGRPRADDRRCLNAILYVLISRSLKTGSHLWNKTSEPK